MRYGFSFRASSAQDDGRRLVGSGAILKNKGSFRDGTLFDGGFAIVRLLLDLSTVRLRVMMSPIVNGVNPPRRRRDGGEKMDFPMGSSCLVGGKDNKWGAFRVMRSVLSRS
ncbi:hypothetical protein P3L10_033631 [Capsicum annuum]